MGAASFAQLLGFSSLWQPEIQLPPVLETLDDFYCSQYLVLPVLLVYTCRQSLANSGVMVIYTSGPLSLVLCGRLSALKGHLATRSQ
jgi:hypothetical protein